MSQIFERTVDRKDAIIRSLAKDIEEAEEQYQVALRKHLQNMDDLIGERGKRMADGFTHNLSIQLSKPSVSKIWKMNTSRN